MDHKDIINLLIEKNNYKSYLEIGIANGISFSEINCEYKVGVDPDHTSKGTTYYLTSDDYFNQYNEKFDIILIDGSHVYDQVYKDIVNSLNCLNDNGIIVMHDCNPYAEWRQHPNKNGTCWMAFVQARENFNIEAFTVDTDEGCGIIKHSKEPVNKLVLDCEKNYQNFSKNRENWLNLKNIEYFKSWANND